MKNNNKNILLAVVLVLVVAFLRIITREMSLYNLAPIGALALFSGAIIKDKRISMIVPIAAMLLADIYFQLFTSINGFYGQEQWFVFGAVAAVTLFGTAMGKPSFIKVAGFTVTGSLIFFIISNLGSYFSGMWGKGIEGLVTTYTMAIPFYQNTLVGDLVGSAVFFGTYFLAQRAMQPKVQRA